MKKRFLNLFLALVMVAFVVPTWADAATKCWHDSRSQYCTVEKVEAKAATCTEDGNEEYYYCTFCKKNMKLGSDGVYTERVATDGDIVIPAAHKYVSRVCTECGHCEDNHIHNKIIVEANPATCVEDGAFNTVYQCKDCKIYFCKNASGKYDYNTTGEFPDNVIPATGEHDFSVWQANVTPATCTKREVERYKCATCDETEEREVGPTPVGTHTPGSMTRWIKRPTCKETGEAEYQCTACAEKVIQTIRKLNCEIKSTDKAPTCNNTGLQGGTQCESCNNGEECAYCKENLKEGTVVAALGHNQVLNVNHEDYKLPTCTADGVDVFDCTRCGYDAVKVTVPKLGHNQVLDTAHPAYKAATCDKGGMDVLDCTRCGYVDHQVPTEKLGHDCSESVLKEATCTIDGMEYHQCKREGCGYWKYVKITKLGHKKVDVPAVAPTCTATGLTVGEKCERCDHTFKAQSIVDKLSHAWKDITAKDPTCEEDGYNAHRECENCGETDGMNTIPAGAAYHDYENFKCIHCEQYDPNHQHAGTETVITPATCTAAGVKKLECATCDYVNANLPIAMLSHSYGANDRCTCGALDPAHQHTYAQTDYREPTCDIGGQVTKQCSVCGDTTQTTINALGHSYSNGRCIRCGTAAACTHSTTNTTVTREATCKLAGQKVTSCTGCGKVMKTESIPATGNHNYVNDYCTGCGQVDPYKKTADNQDVYPLG